MPYIPPVPEGSIKVTPTQNLSEIEQKVSERFLESLAQAGVTEIKRLMKGGALKNPTGALESSVQSKIEEGAVIWFSDKPYSKAIEKGMQPRQMMGLIGKTVPLMIVKSGGQTKVFRKVTLRSILTGKFSHPGFPGKHFFQRGIQIAMSQAPRLWAEARRAVMMVMY